MTTGDQQDAASESDISTALRSVHTRTATAAHQIGRDPEAIALVAASKTIDAAGLEAAMAAGQRLFGENHVQEAAMKWPALRARHPDCAVHLIGPLQSNKVRQALALFDVIETVDRPKLAAALAREMVESGRRIPCFLQINTGEEPQKAGVAPQDADRFINTCRNAYALPVIGLMCIPPLDAEPAPHFELLRQIAARNGLSCLSMGMSNDFETAILFGATHIRVGRALFGARTPHATAPRP